MITSLVIFGGSGHRRCSLRRRRPLEAVAAFGERKFFFFGVASSFPRRLLVRQQGRGTTMVPLRTTGTRSRTGKKLSLLKRVQNPDRQNDMDSCNKHTRTFADICWGRVIVIKREFKGVFFYISGTTTSGTLLDSSELFSLFQHF